MISQIYLRADLAGVFADLGDVDRAQALIREATALAEDGNTHLMPYVQARSALMAIAQGELTTAGEILAAMWAKDAPINIVQPRVLTLADCLLPLAQGEHEKAVQRCQERLADLRKYGLRGYVSETLLVRGKALTVLSRTGEAEDALREALECAREMGARWVEWQILVAWSILHPKGERGDVKRAQAQTLIEEIANNLDDPQLRNSFMAREDAQQMLVDSPSQSIQTISEPS